MIKVEQNLDIIKLVGITVRTNNSIEKDVERAKIGKTLQKYFSEGIAEKINARKNPGRTFCIYTNYESDFTGDYTYFVGEEVASFERVGNGLESLITPKQRYIKFTNKAPGEMPYVCINMWQNIWKMNANDLGDVRSYIADFEVYDERSINPKSTILDIYIGIKT